MIDALLDTIHANAWLRAGLVLAGALAVVWAMTGAHRRLVADAYRRGFADGRGKEDAR